MSGVIKTKIYAILLGTFGIGITSQLFNINGLVVSLGTIGLPLGLTKYISELESDGKRSEIYSIINQVIFILISFSFILIALTIAFSNEISSLLLNSNEYKILIILTSISFPFSALLVVLDSYFKGLKDFNRYVKLTIINTIISLAISIILVYEWGLLGVALSLPLSTVMSLSVYIYMIEKYKLLDLKLIFKFEFKFSKTIKSIFIIGFGSLVIGVTDYLTMLAIRSLIIKLLGIDANGIYQSLYSISNNYFNIFFMSISIYLVPVISAMKEKNLINSEINSVFRVTIMLIVPILSFTFTARQLIIVLLYSDKFLSVTDLFVFNFIGDYFKALSWVLASWLLPASKIKIWVLYAIIYNFNYFVLFYILIYLFDFGLKSVVIAYMFANIVHFLINWRYIRLYNDFRFITKNIKLFFTSFIALTIILLSSSFNLTVGYILLLPVILIWLKLSLKKDEITKLVTLIKSRFLAGSNHS